MTPERRAYWQDIEADNLRGARNESHSAHRRGGSALFAGQAAFLIGRPVTANPFGARSRLFERWEAGWFVASRHGDPLDEAAAVAPRVSGGRPPARKFSRPAVTHAAKTHPED
jgi:hypothetical protein